jgi:hypothetical protein
MKFNMDLIGLQISIEKILDMWDPIGVFSFQNRPFEYYPYTQGEYTKYVKEIVSLLQNNQDLFSYLKTLYIDLTGYTDDDLLLEIKKICKEINCEYKKYLSFLKGNE